MTKKQVTERANRACAGGLRVPAAFVRSSEKAGSASARLRRCLDKVLRQPVVLEAMLEVVETLGTEACAVPGLEMARVLQIGGVFPQMWEDSAGVEKSKLCDSLEAPHATYRSFVEAGELAEAEVRRTREAGLTKYYYSLDEL